MEVYFDDLELNRKEPRSTNPKLLSGRWEYSDLQPGAAAGFSQFKAPGTKFFDYKKQYDHFNARLIERRIDPAHGQDALDSPLQVGEVKYDNMGRASQQYIGGKL